MSSACWDTGACLAHNPQRASMPFSTNGFPFLLPDYYREADVALRRADSRKNVLQAYHTSHSFPADAIRFDVKIWNKNLVEIATQNLGGLCQFCAHFSLDG